MGCWNGTCALSNLPILSGEEVVVYVLKKNSHPREFCGGICYSTDLYTPLPFPILGKYDDYGLLDPICTDLTLLNEYFDSEGLTPIEKEGFLRDVERGNFPEYSLILMHRELYTTFIEEVGLDSHWMGEGSFKDIILQKIVGAIDYFNDLNSELKSLEVFHNLPSIFNNVSTFFGKKVLEGNVQAMEGLIEQTLLIPVFERGRRFFYPQAGAGSQDCNYDYSIAIGEFAQNRRKLQQD